MRFSRTTAREVFEKVAKDRERVWPPETGLRYHPPWNAPTVVNEDGRWEWWGMALRPEEAALVLTGLYVRSAIDYPENLV